MQIKIYEPLTLEPLCLIMQATSVQWTRRFYDVGGFEMHFKTNLKDQQHLKIGNIVSHKGNYGIIQYLNQTGNDLKVCGNDLKGFCRIRQVIPPFFYKTNPLPIDSHDRVKGNAETVAKHYINTQLVNPRDLQRRIPNLTIANNRNRGRTDMAWQAAWESVDVVLQKMSAYSELGYDIVLDAKNKIFVFDVIEGIKRTRSQKEIAPVIFCREYRNIDNCTYTYDTFSAVNVAYLGGNGEAEQQFVYKLADGNLQTGFARYEGYASFNSDDEEEFICQGKAHLKDNAVKECLEADVNQKLEYKKDWFLGDYVTLKMNVFGENLYSDVQVTEVHEVYERERTSITPVFGEKKKNIIKKLLKG